MMSENFNKYEQFLEEVLPKTNNEKNEKNNYVKTYKNKNCINRFSKFFNRV